jgi:hypothetical protein
MNITDFLGHGMTKDSNPQTSSLGPILNDTTTRIPFDFDIEKDIAKARKNALPTVLNESVFVILKW